MYDTVSADCLFVVCIYMRWVAFGMPYIQHCRILLLLSLRPFHLIHIWFRVRTEVLRTFCLVELV